MRKLQAVQENSVDEERVKKLEEQIENLTYELKSTALDRY